MATSQTFSTAFLSAGSSVINAPTRPSFPLVRTQKRVNFKIQAAVKIPAGRFFFFYIIIKVEFPKEEPKFRAPFLGFTRTAETWNSRACMMGLIGTFIVELILNKGILEMIGVEIGKGLDIPL
ncbi:hypothetical protein ACP275_12G171700 [Erythranthe tilingii]